MTPAARPCGGRWIACLVASVLLVACAPAAGANRAPASPTPRSTPPAGAVPAASPAAQPPVNRLAGAAAGLGPLPPGVPFTGRLLIADRGHDRIIEVTAAGTVDWMFPQPGQRLPVPFGPPDDAFYTPDGTMIIANSEQSQTVTAISRAAGTVLWQVGRNGVRSRATGMFNEPDDAVPGPDGTIWVADIRNCRLVHLSLAGTWLGTAGTGVCRHGPPASYGEPNGAFPAADGSLIVTEITGSWVTWLNADGTVRWSVRAPVRYPSDGIPEPDGSVLLTDYSQPGSVVRISSTGATLWRYTPSGSAALNHTSIAIPVASNRVAICDDFHHRIIVVDPTTNQVVWTYTGSGPSRIFYPDGVAYEPSAG